jgi:hypothetical protein
MFLLAVSSRRASRFGETTGSTAARSRVWAGGSATMKARELKLAGTSPMMTLPADEKSRWFLSTHTMSS